MYGATVGYDYLAILIFALFAVFVPVSFLMTSKMLRPRGSPNRVKNAPYESAEETIGGSRDIENEYLPFFALFLPFEIIAIIMLLWSIGARSISYTTDLMVLGLAVGSMGFAIVGYKFISDRNV